MADWPNRDLRGWLSHEFFRDQLGPPPPCEKGLPENASRRLRRYAAKTDFFQYEELAWMDLQALLDHDFQHKEDLSMVEEWIQSELLPGIADLELDSQGALRLILATY